MSIQLSYNGPLALMKEALHLFEKLNESWQSLDQDYFQGEVKFQQYLSELFLHILAFFFGFKMLKILSEFTTELSPSQMQEILPNK